MSEENTRKSEDLSKEQLKQIAGGTVNTNRDVTMNPKRVLTRVLIRKISCYGSKPSRPVSSVPRAYPL